MDWNNRSVSRAVRRWLRRRRARGDRSRGGTARREAGLRRRRARRRWSSKAWARATRTRRRMYGDTNWIFEGQEIFKRAVLGMSGACADVLRSAASHRRGHRPRRAAPGQPADHRGGGEARGHADGERVRERAPLRQHVRRHGARGAGRGDRGRPRQAGSTLLLPAFGAGLTWCAHLVRWGDRVTPKGNIRRGTAAVRPDGASKWCGNSGAGKQRTRPPRPGDRLGAERPPPGRDG